MLTLSQFIAQAEEKINQCIAGPIEVEPQIELICGPGVDPAFDQLISALGHIASQKPKPLIDSMMLWRRSKSDSANEARSQLQQVRGNVVAFAAHANSAYSHQEMPFLGSFFDGIRSPSSLCLTQTRYR